MRVIKFHGDRRWGWWDHDHLGWGDSILLDEELLDVVEGGVKITT